MENTRENAEKFHWDYENKNGADWLSGVPDLVDYLTKYGKKIENKYFPNDAHSFEVFAIKETKNSPTGKEAYIGYKLNNGNFHFISVPFTEPINKRQNWFYKIFKNCLNKLKLKQRNKTEKIDEHNLRQNSLNWWNDLTAAQKLDFEFKTFGYGELFEDNISVEEDIIYMYEKWILQSF